MDFESIVSTNSTTPAGQGGRGRWDGRRTANGIVSTRRDSMRGARRFGPFMNDSLADYYCESPPGFIGTARRADGTAQSPASGPEFFREYLVFRKQVI